MTTLSSTDTESAVPMLFLSYSRNEIYFAEAVVKALQADGINVWFDLQRLETGTDWAASIQSGLEQAQGLVLIASRSSLDSTYVADEWEAILKRRLPVYVVLFEAVSFRNQTKTVNGTDRTIELETLLANAACIIDCRARFHKNMRRLIDCIHGVAAYKDAVPRLMKFNLPTRVPFGVGAVTFALLAHLMLIVAGTLTVLSATLPSFLLGLIISFLLGYQLYEFLVRYIPHEAPAAPPPSHEKKRWVTAFQYNQIRWTVLAGFFSGFIFFNAFPVFSFFVWLVLLIAFVTLNTAQGMLNWSPRGQAPRILRRGMHLRQRIPSYPPASSGKKYQLYANEADKPVASAVRYAMNRAGHVEGWQEEGSRTDFRVMVASNFTQESDVTALKETQDAVIVVFASGLTSTALTDPFGNRQQTDWRTRNRILLNKMAVELRDDVPALQDLSVYLMPQDFRQYVLPTSVTWIRWLLFAVGGFLTLLGGVTAGAGLSDIQAGNTNHGANYLALVMVVILPLSFGLFTIFLINRIIKREYSLRRFLLLVLLPLVLVALLITLGTGLIILLPLVLILLGWNYMSLRLWLPPINPRGVRFWGWWHHDRELLSSSLYTYATIILLALSAAAALMQFHTLTLTSSDVPLVGVALDNQLQFRAPAAWLHVPIESVEDVKVFSQLTENPLMSRVFGVKVSYTGRIQRLLDQESALISLGQLKWIGFYAPSRSILIEQYFTVWRLKPDQPPEQVLKVSDVDNAGWEVLSETARDQNGIHLTERRLVNPNVDDTLMAEVWYVTLDTPEQDYFVYLMANPRMTEIETQIMERVISSMTVRTD